MSATDPRGSRSPDGALDRSAGTGRAAAAHPRGEAEVTAAEDVGHQDEADVRVEQDAGAAPEQKPAEREPAEQKPPEQNPPEQKLAEQTPPKQKPAEQTPATQQPAAQTPAAHTPAAHTPAAQKPAETRIEHDQLGALAVPAHAYYGVHTQRAVDNFPISGVAISHLSELVVAIAAVKQAAATANAELGLLDPERASAIIAACEEIRGGALREQFVVDIVQGGAGTSTNMNANEVIANRALELMGYPKGSYDRLHPLDHVNLSQSTNDVYPSAAKIAVHWLIGDLLRAMETLEEAFSDKAWEFADVITVGRTQLQDAVPMTLGQEFGAYAVTLAEDRKGLADARILVEEINLGGTAVGTGLNAHPRYGELARRHLAELTGIPLKTAPDLVEATQDAGAFVQLSGVLKRIAVKLSKTCNDLRLLSSGPRAGFGDINLPAVQAGSSIMPGKVNPVIPEMVNQVAFEVIGNDVTITMAAEAGELQLNAFEPVIVSRTFNSMRRLSAACRILASRCVRGITANREHLEQSVRNSIGLATALTPHIGYVASTALAAEALATGASVADLALESGLIPPELLAQILSPENLLGRRDTSVAKGPVGEP